MAMYPELELAHQGDSTSWGHKAMAVLALLGASALFVALIVWPVIAPLIPMEYAPGALFDAAVGTTFDDAFDKLR